MKRVPPEISVVIPTKDRPDLLRALLDSVRAQSIESWEAIVVDDGSSHDAVSSAKALAAHDERLRFLQRTSRVRGACSCRNEGLRAARADLVVFFDDDDLLSPTCLGARVDAMRAAPDADLVVFPYDPFRELPGDLPGTGGPAPSVNPLEDYLRLEPPWHTGGPVWRRRFLDRIGGWDERLSSWQDLEFGVRALTLAPRFEYRDRPEFHVRVASDRHRNISGAGWASRNVRSWAVAVEAMADQLGAAGLLDARRRALLGVLYLFVAERLVEIGDHDQAGALLSRSVERQLVARALDPLARLLLRAARLRPVRPVCQYVLFRALASRPLTSALSAFVP